MPEEKYDSLAELYAAVELNARNYDQLQSIGGLFQRLRDSLTAAGSAEDAEKAQVELDSLTFFLKEGSLHPMYQATTEDGKAAEYPSISRFGDPWIGYLKHRVAESKSPILVARYSHILWLATGDVSFATAAVSNYLLSAREYQKSDSESPESLFASNMADALKAAGGLALSIRSDKTTEVVSETVAILRSCRRGDRPHTHLLLSMTRYLLENRKKLGRSALPDCLALCLEEFKRQFASGDFHVAIDFAELCIRLDIVTGNRSLNWHEEIGKSYEGLAQSGAYDNFAKVSFVEDAILHFRKAKLPDRAAALQEKLVEARRGVRFGKIEGTIDLAPQLKECERVATLVCDKGFDYLVGYLMHSKDLLPDYDNLVESVSKGSPLRMVIPSTIVDSLGNSIRRFSSDDEKQYFAVLQDFGVTLDTTSFLLLRALLFEGQKRGILNGPRLSEYLSTRSWIGRPLRSDSGVDAETYRWIDQIIPAVNDYFISIDMHLKNPAFRPSFVECIDSLTTKFEGLVRDICRLSGVSTVEVKEDRNGNTMSTEKDLHALLYEPTVAQLFDKTDLLFLRHLLVEHAGYCIRHKVAHSQMALGEYRLKTIHYLLLALLRISRYDLRPTS